MLIFYCIYLVKIEHVWILMKVRTTVARKGQREHVKQNYITSCAIISTRNNYCHEDDMSFRNNWGGVPYLYCAVDDPRNHCPQKFLSATLTSNGLTSHALKPKIDCLDTMVPGSSYVCLKKILACWKADFSPA